MSYPTPSEPSIALAAAVVINLRRRTDRLARFTTRWRDTGTAQPFTVFTAIDTGGPDGCLASHLQVLARFSGPLLVMEDDCCFTVAFTPTPPVPPADWAVAWLGGQHRIPPEPVDATWARVTSMLRTHCYVARHPRQLGALLARGCPTRMDPDLMQVCVPQYVLRSHTVGQAAGLSDIDGRYRSIDHFWQHTADPRPPRG